jgi:hypothetical protein
MYPYRARTLCAGILMSVAGCGQLSHEAPQSVEAAPSRQLQRIPFTGVADPVRGSLQLTSAPQALFGKVTEDTSGNPLTAVTAAPGTAQVYGTGATWPVKAPTACTVVGAPGYMAIQVEVRSDFTTQQLRNVYARIGYVTTGHTFCAATTPSTTFVGSGSLSPNLGLYLYKPLDSGTAAGSTMFRTVEWDMNLPDNGAFSFSGDLWAEVIPQPPTMTLSPVPDATNSVSAGGRGAVDVTFTWVHDTLASGTDPEGFGVLRPSTTNWIMTLDRCGLNSAAFDPLNCTTNLQTQTNSATGTYSDKFTVIENGNQDGAFWFRARVVHNYRLPGETSDRNMAGAVAFKVTR